MALGTHPRSDSHTHTHTHIYRLKDKQRTTAEFPCVVSHLTLTAAKLHITRTESETYTVKL